MPIRIEDPALTSSNSNADYPYSCPRGHSATGPTFFNQLFRTDEDQRKERRYLVQSRGELRTKSENVEVNIVEVSNSGAFVFLEKPLLVGEEGILSIEKFGTVQARVAHSGWYSCRLAIEGENPSLEELLGWAVEFAR